MSNTKTKYVNGVRLFNPGDNAPQNLLANVLITPKLLIECLKQDEVQDAKSEYKGDTQYKANLWKNDDGSLSMSFNTYKPTEQKETKVAQGETDLPW
jgi:hypothetical protein